MWQRKKMRSRGLYDLWKITFPKWRREQSHPRLRGCRLWLLPGARVALWQDAVLELGVEPTCGTDTCWNQGSVEHLSSRRARSIHTILPQVSKAADPTPALQ